METLWNRFHSKFQPVTESGCWIWMGAIAGGNYGSMRVTSTTTESAHRVAWKLYKGPIPDGIFVCHTCDVMACVNPSHLWLGTHTQNMRDSMAKGRNRKQFTPL